MKRTGSVLLLALVLTACIDRTTGPVLEGHFDASVSGEYDEALSGSARFGVTPGEGFAITFMPGDPNHLIGLGFPADERPEVGSYTVGDPESEFFFAFYARSTVEGIVTFISYDGTMEITASDSDEIEGWLSFLAVGELPWEPGVEAQILVDITFTAVCASGARCN